MGQDDNENDHNNNDIDDEDIETPKHVEVVATANMMDTIVVATAATTSTTTVEAESAASTTSPAATTTTGVNNNINNIINKSKKSILQRLYDVYQQQEFLILILAAIGLAKLYPKLGAVYLQPDITATWVAVMLIFLLAGISLRTSELSGAISHHWKFHVVVQIVNLGIIPAVVFGISRALSSSSSAIISQELADGMVVCACLPMTINMVMVLTKAAHGDEASALVGSVLGNAIGVVVSPLLILAYLGVQGNVDIGSVFYKLAVRVLLPVVVGQVVQKTTRIYESWYLHHKTLVTKLQQLLLAFIVYTVFCETFSQDQRTSISDIFLMIAFQFTLLVSFMLICWYVILKTVAPRQRVMGLYGCTHKTVAIGIPLIQALYEESTPGHVLALYALPLLVWHPLQLVVGTLIAPYLAAYVLRANDETTNIDKDNNDNNNNNNNNKPTRNEPVVDEADNHDSVTQQQQESPTNSPTTTIPSL